MSDTFQNDPLSEAQRTYSPLPQMVQRFREQFGPRPAPRAPPNIEQQAAQDDQPPEPPPDRMRQMANNYLPPGGKYPPSLGYQAFRPNPIPRVHGVWGQPEPFPNLPMSFEAPNLLGGVSQFFGQNGSVPSQLIAQAMAQHPAEFMAGLQKGQEERAKLALEQLRIKTAQLNATAQEELYRYRDVLAAHGALNDTTDPSKMIKPVNGKSLMEDMYDTAREIGDIGRPGTLGDLIASGAKPSEIVKFLQARDTQLQTSQKAKATLDEDAREDARLGLPQTTSAQAGGVAADVSKYSGLQEPDSGGLTTQPPELGGPAPPAAPKSKILIPDSDGKMVPADSPGTGADTGTPIDEIKHGIIAGAKQPPNEWLKSHKKVYDEATDRALEVQRSIANIIKHTSPDATPAERAKILPMVAALDPQLARDVDLVSHYKDPASGGQSGTGASLGAPASQYSNLVRQVVSLINPEWNQGNYQQRQLFQKDIRVQNVLARSQDLQPMAMQLADDLRVLEKDLKARGLNANSVNLMGLLERFGDDPKYIRMRSDLLAYNNAYNTLVTAGHNTITGVKMQEGGLDPWAPIATYRGVMQGHAVGASGMVKAMQNRWRAAGGGTDPMPGADPDDPNFTVLHNISKWDNVSGAMPYDPKNPDNDIVNKKAGPWGAAGHYYWLGTFPTDRDDPRNWKRVE